MDHKSALEYCVLNKKEVILRYVNSQLFDFYRVKLDTHSLFILVLVYYYLNHQVEKWLLRSQTKENKTSISMILYSFYSTIC